MTLHPLALAIALALTPAALAAKPAATDKRPAAVSAAQPEQISSVEGITEYRLANGLRVLLMPDESKAQTLVNVTYRVGSRHENYGETGMAHLLEHLVFKGTKTRGNIMEELGRRGMSFNGTTSWDRTNYFETFNSSEENLRWALEMEADRMVNSRIAREDLEKEFSVVRNEMERGENNPGAALQKQLFAVTFDWHNYGKLPIGARSDVEGVKIDNLQAFYRKYYQPDNAVVLVAGKFDPARTLALIQQQFGSIPKPQRTLSEAYTREAQRDGAREITVSRTGDIQLAMALYPTVAVSHPDSAALMVLGEILGDTPNGRLHKQLVETKKAVNAGAGSMSLTEHGVMILRASLNKTQSLADVRSTLLDTVEHLKQQPITEAELKRAKTALAASIERTLQSPQGLGIRLSESIAAGDWRLFFLQRDRVEAVTLADVQRVAEYYFKPSNRTYGQFVPEAAPDRVSTPEPPALASLLSDYKGKAAMAAGEVFDATPANIDARTQHSTLSNGAKVSLLPKKNRGETVTGAFDFHFGSETSLFGKGATADMAADMLMRGTSRMSRAEISSRLDELQSRMAILGGATKISVGFQTKRQHLPELLALIREILRDPSMPAGEFEQLRQSVLTGIDASRKEPGTLAALALSKHLRVAKPGDIRYAEDLDERAASYKAVTLDATKAFYREQVGADAAQLALVGDFDPGQIKPLLEQHYADWHANTPYQRVSALLPAAKGVVDTLEAPDKPNATLYARFPFAMADTDADFPALMLANNVLGGSTKSRLLARLRQKEGLSYGASSSLGVGAEDPVATLALSATYAPQNHDKLVAAVNEELARLIAEGITDTELADAKLDLAQSRMLSRTQDGSLASALTGQSRLNRTFVSYSAKIDAALAALTRDQVNAAIRKYIKLEQFTFAYAGDFAGAAAKQKVATK